MKTEILKIVKEYLIVVLSAAVYAFGLYYFVFANEFTNGGVAGITTMVNYLIGTDKYGGYINFAINIPLMILAFVGLSKDFAIKSTLHILCVSVMLSIFPMLGENGMAQYTTEVILYSETGEIIGSYMDVGRCILSSVYGGIMCGLSLALVLGVRGSTGGADIVGAFIQRKNPAVRVQWGIFVVNSIIIGISAIVYSYNVQEKVFVFNSDFFQPVMLALILQFVAAKVCDFFSQGIKSALKFEVITDHPEELANELLSSLKHGVTLVPATGMFEKKNRSLLICVVKKRQIQDFKDILKKYPGTFAYVANVSEIIGIFNVR